ncbi:MAG: ATP-binding protein [Candidatus Lokiarchaeota archaeon]|nr:ATP-binding protein [Candidatus Harpocratesius repetitus]
MFNPFEKLANNAYGRLMQIQDLPDGTIIYEVWFDYCQELYNQINVGSFLAIKNFTLGNKPDQIHYSILKIIKKMPTHYAMLENLHKGYPAFSEEAARSIRDSFTDQISQSDEDLSKIVVTAVSTNYEFIYHDKLQSIKDFEVILESNIAIYGEEAKILSKDAVQKIINRNFTLDAPEIVSIGTMKENEEVQVLIDIEKALKTHFGIFGFTGVGKSNLLSTFISKIFEKKEHIHKILFFDLMDEYLGLLLDLFFNKNLNCYYVYIDHKDLSRDERDYFTTLDWSDSICNQIYHQMVLPRDIKINDQYADEIKKLIKAMYLNRKVKVIGTVETVDKWFEKKLESVPTKIQKKYLLFSDLKKLLKNQGIDMNASITEEIRKKIIPILENPPFYSKTHSTSKKKQKEANQAHSAKQSTIEGGLISEDKKTKKANTFHLAKDFEKNSWIQYRELLISYIKKDSIINYSNYGDFVISMEQIIKDTDDESKSSLYIFSANRDSQLREFLNEIGSKIYDHRKEEGKISPITSLIFDEADTFIPQSEGKDESISLSKQMIEQYARRGRKFGLGIGLATQRVTYLDTTILGQLHTYFVSKLPRKSDRDRIKEAFSFSDEELNETFRYGKGNWLLVSHEGMGIEGVPLSIKSENANDRLIQFFLDLRKRMTESE